MNQISKEIIINDQKITLETGKIARQAKGADLASCDGTTVLGHVSAKNEANANQRSYRPPVQSHEKTYTT